MPKIIEDSRQQAHKHDHIESWMRAHGVEFEPRARALPFGDYMRDGSNISVDTKKDIQELVMDVGRDHARFARECDRARSDGWRLVVLVESGKRYNTRPELEGWTSGVCGRCPDMMHNRCDPHDKGCKRHHYRPMQGETLYKITRRMELEHGVRFVYCDKADTAMVICEILGVNFDSD